MEVATADILGCWKQARVAQLVGFWCFCGFKLYGKVYSQLTALQGLCALERSLRRRLYTSPVFQLLRFWR